MPQSGASSFSLCSVQATVIIVLSLNKAASVEPLLR